MISSGSFASEHLVSCRQTTSGFSLSKNSMPPFLIHARRPSTFQELIFRFHGFPSFLVLA